MQNQFFPASKSKRSLHLALFSSVALAGLSLSPASLAQTNAAAGCDDGALSCTTDGRVIYQPGFFAQFNPITALDMVQRVPGFSIDSGDNVRGFGAAGGNVLIDGQRPSSKSADIETRLSRIGADNVERIELIRGGTGALDVAGQSVVVNVVLRSDQSGSEPSPWEISLLKRRPRSGLRPSGEVTYNGQIGDTKITLGINGGALAFSFDSEEEITRFFGEDERRTRLGSLREKEGGFNINLERPFSNGDIVRLNFEAELERFREQPVETRFLANGDIDIAEFPLVHELYEYEAGADYEHDFSENFGVKLIGLVKRTHHDDDSEFLLTPEMGSIDQSLFLSRQFSGESIGRTEFDWKPAENHSVQFGGEVVHNFLNSRAELFVADGNGGLVPEDLDGANTRVSELRGEAFINDSWRINPKLTLDAGFALELSRISQSGDADNSRFFTYPKPSATLTYQMDEKTQWRLSAKREVNQLSFGQFVSAVNFDDEDIDFGNPELQPERTWAFKLAFERRFGDIGVIELVGFYDYVEDVEDLLPIGGIVEVPGNIGDGEIWGGEVNFTLPLDITGLKNARIEGEFIIRDSSIEDPVTGFDRVFSSLAEYFYEFDFRHDLPEHKMSWGVSYRNLGDRFSFGLDEATTFIIDPELDAFIETTVIDGVKIRLAANDIMNVVFTRDRTVFQGSRALNIPDFREVRDNRNGGGVRLTFSGAF